MSHPGEWTRYWRSPNRPVEAMHAHFRRHSYHRHSHETYSFGVTDTGAQAFTCRGGSHTSAAGMVMAFNPDDPHDGRAADDLGFTYRMIHLGPTLVADVLADADGRPAGLPLFGEPVVPDQVLARRLRLLHGALVGDPDGPADGADALGGDELLEATVRALVRRHATGPRRSPTRLNRLAARGIAERTRAALDDAGCADLAPDDLAVAAGCSRYAVYRAFRAVYGLAPSDYQRQLRLRAARRLLARGHSPAGVAAEVGFADQAHLTRWFVRCFGVTPGAYRAAVRG
ncbi:MAG: helix-turn-helix domain-containing protein [Streptosporangiales bacterium]|nr:helix-turn-helix domain-containing protein [Streptosporangiales bacterium]